MFMSGRTGNVPGDRRRYESVSCDLRGEVSAHVLQGCRTNVRVGIHRQEMVIARNGRCVHARIASCLSRRDDGEEVVNGSWTETAQAIAVRLATARPASEGGRSRSAIAV